MNRNDYYIYNYLQLFDVVDPNLIVNHRNNIENSMKFSKELINLSKP